MFPPDPVQGSTEAPPASPSPCRVLAVDDSEDDLFFLKRALRRNPQFSCIATLTSGQQALKFFLRESPFTDSEYPLPDLLLLDLKMPGLNGFGVLEFLQRAFPARTFKIAVLTSSSAPADERLALELGADVFLTKPAEFSGYLQLLRQVEGLAPPAYGA